jgi:RimJ/RimL family protein N-acetyltransferase
MNWRNEQIYHLRQSKLLTIEDQEKYFTNTVKPLFEDDNPSQILFSFLQDENCIGYGGLVHINWIDKNAEISFIMKTELENNNFYEFWKYYLILLEEIAFKEIRLHKIYTYAYDIRPILFQVLVDSGYVEEATLFEHVLIDKFFKNIRIHSKFNKLI